MDGHPERVGSDVDDVRALWHEIRPLLGDVASPELKDLCSNCTLSLMKDGELVKICGGWRTSTGHILLHWRMSDILLISKTKIFLIIEFEINVESSVYNVHGVLSRLAPHE
jgi:hypothetical protein